VNRDREGYRQGCTYKDFKNCGPPEFNGKGGATAYIQWMEEMEAVLSRSNCTHDTRINYSTGMLKSDALDWWNSEVVTRGRDAAESML